MPSYLHRLTNKCQASVSKRLPSGPISDCSCQLSQEIQFTIRGALAEDHHRPCVLATPVNRSPRHSAPAISNLSQSKVLQKPYLDGCLFHPLSNSLQINNPFVPTTQQPLAWLWIDIIMLVSNFNGSQNGRWSGEFGLNLLCWCQNNANPFVLLYLPLKVLSVLARKEPRRSIIRAVHRLLYQIPKPRSSTGFLM